MFLCRKNKVERIVDLNKGRKKIPNGLQICRKRLINVPMIYQDFNALTSNFFYKYKWFME